jgi:hypothetical protein
LSWSSRVTAGWAVMLILEPRLGALIYLVARGSRSPERQKVAVAQEQVARDEHINQAAGASADRKRRSSTPRPCCAINEAEYDALKAGLMRRSQVARSKAD